jgi:hypothetical protein
MLRARFRLLRSHAPNSRNFAHTRSRTGLGTAPALLMILPNWLTAPTAKMFHCQHCQNWRWSAFRFATVPLGKRSF